MNTLTKSSVIVAAVGVAALILHTGDSDTFSLHGPSDAISGTAVTATPEAQPGTSDPVRQEASVAALAGDATLHGAYEPTAYPGASEPVSVARSSAAQTEERTAEDDRERMQRAAQGKMSGPVAALAMAGGPEPAEIVVSYKDHPDLFEDGRVEELGGEILRHYEVLDLLAIRIPAESLIELAIEDDVKRLSLDEAVVAGSTIFKTVANAPGSYSSNHSYNGNDQTVAILDSGVAQHHDLSGSVRQYSFLNGNFPRLIIDGNEIDGYNSSPRADGYGHGTHIAGIITGTGKSSLGAYSGPASRVDILSLQVLDENGHGQMSDVMAAIDFLLKYGSFFDVSVANLSLGKPITESNTTDPLVLAVERLWDSGVVVVVAAGNYGREGYFSITSPGNSRKVITVGSLTDNGTGSNYEDDYASTYSSRGPTAEDHVVKPDLLAPGNRLVAATPDGSNLATLLPNNVVACTSSSWCSDDYLEMSGTSMATGVVSAAAAMMLEKEPWLSPATVKARLMRSARHVDESPIVSGAGLLDIDAAMDETGVIDGQALSPLMVFDSATGGTLIQDTASLWGDALWGAGYLWTDGVNANGYLWTDGVNANAYLWTDGVNANGYLWTDGIAANGFLWTDGGVAAFGYLWTDGGVNAKGYLWTDGGVNSNGYLWTDGGGFRALSLYDFDTDSPGLNDDDYSSE